MARGARNSQYTQCGTRFSVFVKSSCRLMEPRRTYASNRLLGNPWRGCEYWRHLSRDPGGVSPRFIETVRTCSFDLPPRRAYLSSLDLLPPQPTLARELFLLGAQQWLSVLKGIKPEVRTLSTDRPLLSPPAPSGAPAGAPFSWRHHPSKTLQKPDAATSPGRAASEKGIGTKQLIAKLKALRVKQAMSRSPLVRRRGGTIPPAPDFLYGSVISKGAMSRAAKGAERKSAGYAFVGLSPTPPPCCLTTSKAGEVVSSPSEAARLKLSL
jgi:hypothetical protein